MEPYSAGPYAKLPAVVRYMAYHIGVRPSEVEVVCRMRDLPGGVIVEDHVFGGHYEVVPVGDEYWYRRAYGTGHFPVSGGCR